MSLEKGLPTEDPDFRFTYKVTYTYCVQSTGPILGGQLVENIHETQDVADNNFEEAMQDYLLEETGCRTHVYLANIRGEETENTDWSLF